MKIIVGSKNAAKVTAVQIAAHAYWADAEVGSIEAESGVSAQPIGQEETMQGALNRARAAQASGGDLGVGLEGGVAQYNGQWVMMSFIAVSDGKRDVVVPGQGTPLPHAWGEALKNGAELRPYVLDAGLPYDYKKGVIALLTNDALSRDEMFAAGIKAALAPWVNPAAYEEA